MIETFVVVQKAKAKGKGKLPVAQTITAKNIVTAYTEEGDEAEYQRDRIEKFKPQSASDSNLN